MPPLELSKFNPKILEKKRRNGHAPIIVFLGKRGSGKCFCKDTPILMHNGELKNVQDVEVGDLVMGDDSKPRKVLNLSTGRSPMYKIKQNKGDDYIVNENHVLSLMTDDGIVKDIPIKDYMKLSTKEGLKGYKVSVDFPEKDLPIDPYMFGRWLRSPDKIDLDEKKLKDLNVIDNKHIPHIYKTGNAEQRMELLQGLGNITKYSEDMEFIEKSLGFGYGCGDDGCTGIDVEEMGIDNYYGFEIDGNHRFLLGDFTVTHNSTLVADILYHLKAIPVVVCMSGTEDGNGFYSTHIHDLCIHNKFDPDVLGGLVTRQKRIVKQLNHDGKEAKKHPEVGVGVLMDDLAYDKKMMKDPGIREIFFNGRHYHITTMLTFQYMMDMGPSYRSNVDYVFVCKENKKDNIDKLHKYFFGIFDKPADFRKVLQGCTNDFGCIVLDNTSRSNRIEDQVFWYKAKLDRNYKIGTPEMWREWDKQLRDDDDDDDEVSYSRPETRSEITLTKKGPRHFDWND